ncbi:hypothetical protein EmuJ_000763000 [Echinococcus multilocularis]|uniref:Uncharacterized protein n=1 Tax=Echinococcus multilocularis TaxID=6211 RepID=A0A068Y5J6_ECHMU|nr:hypothetical protein EmuJ_000763000 [Echinococcus multilocularis]
MKVPLTVTTDPLPCSEVYNVYSGVSAPSECLPSFYQWRDLTRNPLYGEGKYRVKWLVYAPISFR